MQSTEAGSRLTDADRDERDPHCLRAVCDYVYLNPARAGLLKAERKGHPVKVQLARRLRGETTVSLKWIAENLSMGTWTHVANLLRLTHPPKKSVKDKDCPL
jgi:hypothetical protein